MLNHMYKVSFRTRIWVSFVVLIIISILVTGWASYNITADILQDNAIQMSQDTVNKSGQVFDEKLQKIAVSIMSLMMSDSFNEVMEDSSLGDKSHYYAYLTEMQPIFSQLQFNERIVQSVLLVTPIGDFYPTSTNRLSMQSFYETELYDRMKKDRKAIWQEGHEDVFFSGRNRVLTLIMEGVAKSPASSNDVYIVVNIKENEMQSLLKQNISTSAGPIFVLNSAGKTVMDPNLSKEWSADLNFTDMQQVLRDMDPGSERANGYFEYQSKRSTYLINYYRSQIVPDWVIYRVQSKSQILSQANAIKWTAIMIMSICAIAALLLANILSMYLTRPLNKLNTLMSKVVTTEDLALRYRSRYTDEVSRAGYSFNQMLDRIEHLIHEIQETENSKRKAEMKALTAQIDPHFFYNALHTVYCKSVLGENEHVNEMIIALSDMFRLGLNNGEDITSLQAELDHVTKYLIIQQNCYEELFDYHIEVDPLVPMDTQVLKLILQPIVENSILHGFKQRSFGGKIRIHVLLVDSDLLFEVSDNGDGFHANSLEELNSEQSVHSHGYALRNIHDRLTIYYNQQAELAIHSRIDQGTQVTIRMPIAREDDADGQH
jgi:two-component system sensor histidine kinase YesM